jgi:hypothetical protein
MGNLLKRHGAIAFIDILATKTKWPAEIAPDFLKKIEALYKDLDDLYELNKNIGDVEKLKKELKKFKSYEVIEKLEIKRRQELSKEVLSCSHCKVYTVGVTELNGAQPSSVSTSFLFLPNVLLGSRSKSFSDVGGLTANFLISCNALLLDCSF